MSKFPGVLIDTLCFHERRDIDVVYTAAFDVRDRAVLAALTQIILRQARSLAGFCDFLEWDRKHHLLFKTPVFGGHLEHDLKELLSLLYRINRPEFDQEMHNVRMLAELITNLDEESVRHLISYGEYLNDQFRRKGGDDYELPYQREQSALDDFD